MKDSFFSFLPDDVVLNIFFKVEDDPRNWARLACVCTKFSSVIRNICWKTQCQATIPTVVSDLLGGGGGGQALPGSWSSLHKLAVCCPGLLHAGVLLDNSDFGLEREIGPDESYRRVDSDRIPSYPNRAGDGRSDPGPSRAESSSSTSWSLYDDLYYDTAYVPADSHDEAAENAIETGEVKPGRDSSVRKRRKICRSHKAHLASSVWNLSREQGNKLLASRFRADCLYICDWPGCVHIQERRNYMLFRGVFKNFKNSRVWRTINDGNRSKVGLKCAFCSCKETWDLHSAFCLRRVFGFHDDGEPVVRAYVCENGHVSGAWTNLPLYT